MNLNYKSSPNAIISYIKSLSESLTRSSSKSGKCTKTELRGMDLQKEQAAVAKRLLLIEKKKQLQEMMTQLKVFF